MGELKPGWKRVRLGDVVDVITSYWDRDPSKPERFVAGEHIDEGSLSIRRWGMTDDDLVPPTFNRRFRANDVLFHSRNLRKLAVPDFDGITGEKLFVLRTRDERSLMQSLLPFLLQNQAFSEYVERMWAGSTNKFLNKTPLLQYEFALPPLEEQRRLVEVLRAANSVAQFHSELANAATALARAAYIDQILTIEGTDWMSGKLDIKMFPTGWELRPASELCSELITKGATPSGCLETRDTGIPFIKVYNLTFTGELDFSVNPTWISTTGHRELRRSAVLPGDVLMNIVGPPLGKVSRVPSTLPEGNINQAIVRFRLPSHNLGTWLETYLLSPVAQAWFALRAKKTSGQKNLTLETCRELPVPIPPDLLDRLQMLQALKEAESLTTGKE